MSNSLLEIQKKLTKARLEHSFCFNFNIIYVKDYVGTLIMSDIDIKKVLYSLFTWLRFKAFFLVESSLCIVSFLALLQTVVDL